MHMSDTKAMSYQKWTEFAIENYELVRVNYNKVIYEANVFDREIGDFTDVSLTLEDVLGMCMNTNMESVIRNSVMKAVYTGYGLEKYIKKVMDEFYVV